MVVVAVGIESSGIPSSWSAGDDRAGVWLLRSLSGDALDEIGAALAEVRRPGDVTVVSIHWGPNWGYEIHLGHRRFAHALIEQAGVDVVHSSHHPIGIEIHRGRPILYGCGDLINDYGGIGGMDASGRCGEQRRVGWVPMLSVVCRSTRQPYGTWSGGARSSPGRFGRGRWSTKFRTIYMVARSSLGSVRP